ncbi:hypothetical protein [Sphingobacterium hungaricum]|uniref:DUF4252 domain-containing protein n=1 Tax=Sphingobacterium hungaricum TaxID=2082723 RepID=A0A928UXG8_9SPHI|nr:hypothetical protein [Sphingobacterium hungaricum]MBE8713271.1 hypothetical protein [Sphingobacterium hungaricum]
MKISFLLFISFFSSQFLVAQEIDSAKSNLLVVKNFIQEIANEQIALDIILSNQVIVNHPNPELYDYLEASLQEIRLNLTSKNLAEIQYIPFTQMQKKDVNDIDLEGKSAQNIYFLKYKDRTFVSLLVENQKIASFTLVSKGNQKAHFVTY